MDAWTHGRFRCVCCDCPTLRDADLELGDVPGWPQDCLLCEWENAEPGRTSDSDDGMSLEQARANARRFNWMYDPNDPPEWMAHRPSDAELKARAKLRQAYTALDEDRSAVRAATLWDTALRAEDDLRAIVDARMRADVDEAEVESGMVGGWEASDESDETDDPDAAESEPDDGNESSITPAARAPTPMPAAWPGPPIPERSLGPFDYPGAPRGAAVIAGVDSSNAAAIGDAVLAALKAQPTLLYGAGYIADTGAPLVIAVLPANAPASAADAVQAFLVRQPGVLGAFIDRRDGAI